MGDWLEGVERVPILGAAGGTWANDLPDRVVLHTTEGDSIESAVATYKGSLAVPQLTVDLLERRTAQHLGLNVSATALLNKPGGTETNRVGKTIQVEIVGRAVNSANRSIEELTYLAEVLRKIRFEGGVDFQFTAPEFLGYPDSYGPSRVRFDADTWSAFNGVCGHEHVYENDHGDPGALDITTTLRIAGGDDDMTPEEFVAKVLGGAPNVVGTAHWGDILRGSFLEGRVLDAKIDALTAQVAALKNGPAPASVGALSEADVLRIAKAVVAEIAS